MSRKRLKPAVAVCAPAFEPRGLRVAAAAQYAGVTHWFIRSAVWMGKLPARRAGKVLIILREDLDTYLNSLPRVEPNAAEWLVKRTGAA